MCATGTQDPVFSCMRMPDFVTVKSDMCALVAPPPVERRACNSQPCPPRSAAYVIIINNEKSAQRRRKHCALAGSKADPKIFVPPLTPFSAERDSQNLISWRWSLPGSTTDPVWWRSMHAISSYSGNRPTNTHTKRQGRLQYTAPQLSAQCNNNNSNNNK